MMEFAEQTVPFIASLVFGAVVWIYLRSDSTPKDGELPYPPSPKKRHWLWKHGEALANNSDANTSHDVIFATWMKKLNSKVISFEVPIIGRMVVVGDAALARHVLNSKSKTVKGGSLFPKSPTYKNIFPLVGKKSIVAMDGPEWSHQRRTFNPGFTPDYLRGIVITIAQKCDRFLEFCEKKDIANNKPTHMLNRAIDLTSDVIAQAAFGEDWGYGSKEDNGGLETLVRFRELTEMIGFEMKNPIQRLNPFRKRKLTNLSKLIDGDMQRLVRRRIASLQKEQSSDGKNLSQRDILSLTLSSVLKENEAGRKSEAKDGDILFSDHDMECMTSQLKTFYFAGHDTTATTISWAYWMLLKNPETLQRARDEIFEHLGKDWVDSVANGNKIPEESTTYENLQKCQYLDAINRETLRLYPPASSTRYSYDPNAAFDKYKIGKSVVHVDFYAIQRDPDIWGEDAEEFRPERFLGDEGRKKISSFGFLPFSKGSRDCIGKYFALLEAKIALASLITRFDGSLVDADKEVFMARLTNIPQNGCLVKLARRSEGGSISTAA